MTMTPGNAEIIHATCLAISNVGVLLLAPSGGGKSDLALRLIDQPGFGIGTELMKAQLVADDRVSIRRNGARLMAQCPKTLDGLFEVRGLGIVNPDMRDEVEIGLAIDLLDAAKIKRMPDFAENPFSLWGLSVPKIAIAPYEASAPAKIRTAVHALKQGFFAGTGPSQLTVNKS